MKGLIVPHARKLLCQVFLGAFLTIPATANAQTIAERSANVSGEAFVRAFLGNCAQNAGNFDIVVNASKALGFTDLPEEMTPLVAPQDPNAEFIGFFVQTGDGAPYLLGVSKSNIEGQSLTSCTVANPYIEATEVVSALKSFAQTGIPDVDETAMGQRYRVWLVNQWVQGAFISLTDAKPMEYDGVSLTIVAPSQN